MKYSTTVSNTAVLPALPKNLFEYFGISSEATIKEIDVAYQSKIGPVEEKQAWRLAWRVLRDPFYATAYHHYGSLPAIIEAGFFDDELSFEVVKSLHDSQLLCTPYHKLLKNIKKNKTIAKPAVLLSSGGFAPLHRGHLEMMELAKQEAERQGYQVIGGYLSPSHDDYILNKPGMLEYGLSHKRVKDTQEAIAEHEWLMVDPWESQYAPTAVNFTDVIVHLEKYLERFISTSEKIEVIYVFGSDNALFSRAFVQHGQGICVQRPGSFEKLEKVESDNALKKNSHVFFSDSSTTIPNISSQDFRNDILKKESAPKNNLNKKIFCLRNDLEWAIEPWLTNTDRQAGEKVATDFLSALKATIQAVFADNKSIGLELIETKAQQKIVETLQKEKNILTLDPVTDGDYHLHVSRLFQLGGHEAAEAVVARPGYPSLHAQIQNIPAGEYVLVDDDMYTQQTLDTVKQLLPETVFISESISLLEKYLEEKKVSNTSILNIADARDFLLGSQQGGLVVELPSGKHNRVPYLLPYVSLTDRSSIPLELERKLSLDIWQLNYFFFKHFPKKLTVADADISCQDTLREIGFNLDTPLFEICSWHLSHK